MLSNILNIYCKNIFNNFLIAESCRTRTRVPKRTRASQCITNFSHLPLQNKVAVQISLDPLTNKTGDVWHVFLKGDFKDMLYGYKFEGKFSPDEGLYYDSSRILLDPCAKVSGPHELFTLLYLLCFFFIPNTFNMYLLTIFSMNKIFSLL